MKGSPKGENKTRHVATLSGACILAAITAVTPIMIAAFALSTVNSGTDVTVTRREADGEGGDGHEAEKQDDNETDDGDSTKDDSKGKDSGKSNDGNWSWNPFAAKPVDMRLVVSGDFEEPREYSLGPADDAPYVCYPLPDEDDEEAARKTEESQGGGVFAPEGDETDSEGASRGKTFPEKEEPFTLQTLTSETGNYSFDLPAGFVQVPAESDNPAIDMAIRNDDLGVTICLGRGMADKTALQMREEWDEIVEYPAHTGARFSRAAPGGQQSGLMWSFVFNERTGIRHVVSDASDGSVMYVDIITDPWPEYKRKGDPHVARWIVEFLSSVRPDGPLSRGEE